MRILVTGAAGFIASHLCEKLNELGHDVVGLDNFNDYYSPNLKRMNAQELENRGISIFEIDLNSNLQSVFEKQYDYIYHLAAQPGISSETPFFFSISSKTLIAFSGSPMRTRVTTH